MGGLDALSAGNAIMTRANNMRFFLRKRNPRRKKADIRHIKQGVLNGLKNENYGC